MSVAGLDLDMRVNATNCPAKDAKVSASLVAKAAATFGLPNLLHRARASPSSASGLQERNECSVIWQTESCCSCTPLACRPMTGSNNVARGAAQEALVRPPSPTFHLYPTTRSGEDFVEGIPVENGGKTISNFHGLSCNDREPNSSVPTGETANIGRDHLVTMVPKEEQENGRVLHESLITKNSAEEEEEEEEGITEKKELAKEEETNQPVKKEKVAGMKKTTHRRRVADYEREWTFRPKLNHASLRLVSRTAYSSLPVAHRLYESRRTNLDPRRRENFTFCPKLNSASLRLAQERAEKLPEMRAHWSQLAAQRMAEAFAHYTFHPNLSRRSLHIVQHMEADFQARQQQHLLRRQRKIEEARSSNSQDRKRSHPITLPTSPSTPPPSHGTPAPSTSCSPSPSHEVESRGGRRLYRRRASKSPHSSNSNTGRSPCKTPHKDAHTIERRPSSTPVRRLPYSSPVTTSPALPTASPDKPPLIPEGLWGQLSSTDRIKRVKILAERAIKNRKVFVCRGGYKTIQRCLRERGWVEKEYSSTAMKELESPYQAKTTVSRRRVGGRGRSRDVSHTHSYDSDSDDGKEEEEEVGGMEEEEYRMLCRAVRNADPNFVWTLRRDDTLYRNMLPSTFANHFAKASSFTTKVGLCTNLRSLVWCGEANSDLFFPRCYLLSSLEEKDTFINNYHFTTALNLLKLVINQHWGEFRSPNNTYSTPQPNHSPTSKQTQNLSRPPTNTLRPPSDIRTHGALPETTEKPVVPEEAIELALRACTAYVSCRQHDDIEEGRTDVQLTKEEWKTLVKHYYKIVLESGQFECSSQTVRKASNMLDEVEQYLPQLHMDGVRNIWIVKPGAMSRGRGIVCLERLEPILDLVSSPFHKETRWVVQKYIERPLLIYGTKFDIRQWFLVTDWNPLTMWLYKDCYLRFATQKFTLDNMNESIHLCNNSIQKHYINSGSRSELLPDENMWHSSTFKDYLQSLGEGRQWDQVIYPGMKHALTCALQVSQDLVECRKNSFELYGADFMLTDDFTPWLIEINCSPTMEPSTSVTSQLCTEVMKDTIRVVLDRREDKDCDTGKFELAYKQPKFDTPSYVGIQLCVEGVAIHQNHTHHHHRPGSLPIATLSFSNKC